ncbi:hypothetical protein O6H91_11G106900 [Diphasiastrum complanatum]|uniref:Uncharacterized protein n=1 Tax=Diphasiastrum complanatum TaxID=34168 RepID=A0ACC2CCJ6_DIPCM|nr:hypothetical protein O6H91_11G106900 [Diphasiastrum complanatum]
MGYIGKHGVEALRRYKYSGVDRSYVAKYVLQPFWSRFVTIFPLWFPPNMITLIGFGFILISALLSYIYSPHLDSPPPTWVHVAHGLLLFLYQTFDAVDGKQARRTNSSSPLGELFDHGCDALSCAFETMAFGASVMSGSMILWFWAIAAIPFYSATWEHFFTNALILPEVNGPTEGLLLISSAHFFTAIVDMTVQVLVIWIMMIVAVTPTVAYNIFNVYKIVQAKNQSMISALAMFLPFFALLGGITTWCLLSPSDILGAYPYLVLMGIGLDFGYLVGKMILAHLTDEHKGLVRSMFMTLLVFPLAIANALFARFFKGSTPIDEKFLLQGYLIYTVILYFHFAVSVIKEITATLNIYCFRIGRRKVRSKNKRF